MPSRVTSSSNTSPELSPPSTVAGGTNGEAPSNGAFWSTARPDQRALALGFAGLAVVAWLTLVAWGASPYGRYLHHGSLDALQVPGPLAVALFVAGLHR